MGQIRERETGVMMSTAHRTWCVPSAVACAIIYGIKTGRPVRIAIFDLGEGVNHAQAQVQGEDGHWVYLTEYWTGECMAARLYRENHPDCAGKEPIRYYTVTEFLAQQSKALGLEGIL